MWSSLQSCDSLFSLPQAPFKVKSIYSLLSCLFFFPTSTFPGPMTTTTYHSKDNGTKQSIDCVEPGNLKGTNPSVSTWEKTG